MLKFTTNILLWIQRSIVLPPEKTLDADPGTKHISGKHKMQSSCHHGDSSKRTTASVSLNTSATTAIYRRAKPLFTPSAPSPLVKENMVSRATSREKDFSRHVTGDLSDLSVLVSKIHILCSDMVKCLSLSYLSREYKVTINIVQWSIGAEIKNRELIQLSSLCSLMSPLIFI